MEKKKIVILAVGITFFASALIWQVVRKNKSSVIEQPSAIQQSSKAPKVTKASEQEDANIKVASLMFNEKQKTVTTDQQFAVKTMIDPKGKKISAAELHIAFDKEKLKLEKIVASDIFSLVLSEPKIDNEKGVASIVVGVPLGKTSISDIAEIATFEFNSLSKGQAVINITDKSGAAADGETTNVVSTYVPLNVTIE